MIENIRSYNEEVIDFPRGITLFEGDIGSGKSTILMGIEFALFGLGSQKPEALLAKKAEQGSITLNFTVDKENYEVKRTLKRKSGSVSQDAKNTYIKIGDEKEPLSPSELKQRVLQILKFNEPGGATAVSKIFRYAVYTPQEEMKQVLSDTEKRLETIRRAFGVEDYKTAAENAKGLTAELKLQIARFEERTRGIEDFDKNIEDAKEQILEIEKKINEDIKIKNYNVSEKKTIKLDLAKCDEKIRDKTKLETDLDNLDEKITDKKGDLEEFQGQIDDAKETLEEIRDKLSKQHKITKPTTKSVSNIELEIKKFKKIDGDITKTQSQMEQLSDDVGELEETLGKNKDKKSKLLNQEKDKLEKENEKLESARNAIEKDKKKVEATLTRNKTIQEGLQEEIDKFAKIGSKCPYCESKITKEHLESLESERKEKLAEIKKILKNSMVDLEKINSSLEKQDALIENYESKISELDEIIPDLEDYEKKLIKLQPITSQINNLLKQSVIPKEKEFVCDAKNPVEYLTELKDALVEYENSQKISDELKIQQNNAKNDLEKYQNKLKTTQKSITELEHKHKDISSKIDSYEGLDDEIDEINEKLESVQGIIDVKSESLAENRVRLQNENEKVEENVQHKKNAEKWRQSYLKYRNYYDWIREFFIPTIDKIEKQVLLSIQQNFNEIYRNWYSMLIDDPTKESRIDENFTPIVDQDGYDQDINYLSGGEKTSIALAYRLTLNSLIRKETESMKSNLLILDEPTDGFSKTQLSKVRELLDELHSQQIILVSHEKELETYVDNVFQVSKSEGYSRVTRRN